MRRLEVAHVLTVTTRNQYNLLFRNPLVLVHVTHVVSVHHSFVKLLFSQVKDVVQFGLQGTHPRKHYALIVAKRGL